MRLGRDVVRVRRRHRRRPARPDRPRRPSAGTDGSSVACPRRAPTRPRPPSDGTAYVVGRLHRQPLAGHDRRLEAGAAGARRRPPALTCSATRRSTAVDGEARDRRRLAARRQPRAEPCSRSDPQAARVRRSAPARPDDTRARRRRSGRRLRDRRPRRHTRHADGADRRHRPRARTGCALGGRLPRPAPTSPPSASAIGSCSPAAAAPSGTESALSELDAVTTAVTAAPPRAVRHERRTCTPTTARTCSPGPRATRGRSIYVPNSQSDTVDVIDPRTYTVVEHFARRRACRSTSCLRWDLKTLYVTNDIGQQPDADRSTHRASPERRSRSTTRTTCTSPRRPLRDRRRRAAASARLPRRAHLRAAPSVTVPCAGRRPHGLLRRRPLSDRELRVLRADDQGRRRARARGRHARPARRRARCRRT